VSGHDCVLVVHLNERTHEAALQLAANAERLLTDAGYLVTRRPALPHVPQAIGAWRDDGAEGEDE
jgi:hypothetical protein